MYLITLRTDKDPKWQFGSMAQSAAEAWAHMKVVRERFPNWSVRYTRGAPQCTTLSLMGRLMTGVTSPMGSSSTEGELPAR